MSFEDVWMHYHVLDTILKPYNLVMSVDVHVIWRVCSDSILLQFLLCKLSCFSPSDDLLGR